MPNLTMALSKSNDASSDNAVSSVLKVMIVNCKTEKLELRVHEKGARKQEKI